MSQNIRALPGCSERQGSTWKVAGSGLGEHVGLVDPGEALDRRAVEADALGEGPLELGGRDRDRLEEAEHVGEPEPYETDVALLQRAEHELLLLVHVPDPAARVFRGSYMTGRTPNVQNVYRLVGAALTYSLGQEAIMGSTVPRSRGHTTGVDRWTRPAPHRAR